MKIITFCTFALGTLLSPLILLADEAKAKPENISRMQAGDEEIKMLRKFLDMPPARLRMLRKTIERIESYSDEEKRAMRQKLLKLRESDPIERKKMLHGFRKRYERLNAYWNNLPEEKRRREMKEFQSLSIPARKKYIDDLNMTR